MSVARVFQEVPVVKSFDRSPASPELIVVMPAYNEQESLRKVVLEWFAELECWTDRFVFLAIDDGSRDDTRRVLERLREQLGPRFELLCHANRGHGQSCLVGYRMACERGIPWVLQIDSDGQCDPQFFHRFWRDRSRYDVIYGYRWRRDDGVRRMIASMVLKATLAFSCRTWCRDANVPYRLMQTQRLLTVLDRVLSGASDLDSQAARHAPAHQDKSVCNSYIFVMLSSLRSRPVEARDRPKAPNPPPTDARPRSAGRNRPGCRR
jgi:dolichol-phosphate mannosyltransferase